ncbi:non-canonical purine NTP pyrophosphatase [Burkholderia pseudomallei]|uniref:non-canonical purine NTP pyrophosphatase n=1 Tax=Burkholderia pseudomallei TaxID=28450 RepID=UPI00161A285B|nr:non-canonical purine NTP pyrophosphatase [Burkholderia pseudomallei]
MVFFTSNPTKLAHFRYLGAKHGVRVRGFKEKHYHATYHEPQIDDREELLRQSYGSALRQWQRRTGGEAPGLFFLEDTSVEVRALSHERETPGVNVKYWMKDMTFEKLDGLLKAHGNDRRVVVRSDIVVHLPASLRKVARLNQPYLHVRGESCGSVCEAECVIEPNLVYPWLDAKSFNRWFVPDGAAAPLSALPISDADRFDFRARAFEHVIKVLDSLHLLPQNTTFHEAQLALEGVAPVASVYVICGPTCAGKTTLAEWLDDRYGLTHIEASDFMRKAYWERHGLSSAAEIGDFAEAALRTEPQIVAQPIASFIRDKRLYSCVVTGFRSPREIEVLIEQLGPGRKIEIIYLTAEYATRFQRACERNRQKETETTFAERNAQEQRMGLEQIALLDGVARIHNDGTLPDLYATFSTPRRLELDLLSAVNRPDTTESALENLILLTLFETHNTLTRFTTTEIAARINALWGITKFKDNVSRYFNQEFHPYFKAAHRADSGAIEYNLSATGVSAAKYLRRQGGAATVSRRSPKKPSNRQLDLDF